MSTTLPVVVRAPAAPRPFAAGPHDPVLAPDAPLVKVLDWALAHAQRAPSELNSQPWRPTVVLHDHGRTARIELRLDEARLLPHVDPDDREAILACGAWLLNLRIALAATSLTAVVEIVASRRSDVLALIEVTLDGGTREVDRDLRRAVFARATHRGAFAPGVVDPCVLDHLTAEAAREGALVTVLGTRELDELDRLSTGAVRIVRLDHDVQHEVAAWSRPHGQPRDGVPGAAHGLNALQSWLEPTRLRHGMSHTSQGEAARYAAEPSATVLALGSPDDSRAALLRAGAGMQRLLLRATACGLAASYRNAALHVPELRRELARVLQLDHPQVVLRLGQGTPTSMTGRLPADS